MNGGVGKIIDGHAVCFFMVERAQHTLLGGHASLEYSDHCSLFLLLYGTAVLSAHREFTREQCRHILCILHAGRVVPYDGFLALQQLEIALDLPARQPQHGTGPASASRLRL